VDGRRYSAHDLLLEAVAAGTPGLRVLGTGCEVDITDVKSGYAPDRVGMATRCAGGDVRRADDYLASQRSARQCEWSL
jgi:hypothetical protein